MDPLEPEDNPGDDSGVDDVDEESSTRSLTSSALANHQENGRTYRSLGLDDYPFPNDEIEQERLDQINHMWLLVNDGKLFRCPLETPRDVLDVGTGTGIWSIDVDEHPGASVIGVDLSPIQPDWTPSNCRFQIFDVESPWTWDKQFNFVFVRGMAGGLKSWESLVRQAYANLEPGGYLEVQEHMCRLSCDDGTTKETKVLQWTEFLVEAADSLRRPIEVASDLKSILTEVGFIDVVETRDKVPMNEWPLDKRYRELGVWCRNMLHQHLEGISMALMTRGLGWSAEEVRVFLVGVRKDISNVSIHGYWPLYVVYGRKPGNQTSESLSDNEVV